jgi:hypothetical protein
VIQDFIEEKREEYEESLEDARTRIGIDLAAIEFPNASGAVAT